MDYNLKCSSLPHGALCFGALCVLGEARGQVTITHYLPHIDTHTRVDTHTHSSSLDVPR